MQTMSKNKKPGPRPFKPTQRQRNMVEICMAGGLTVQETATVIGICANVLRANFPDELQYGSTRQRDEVLFMLHGAARRGSVGAMKYLLTLFFDGPVFIGKKQRKQQEAESALSGNSEWGDDLAPITKLQ